MTLNQIMEIVACFAFNLHAADCFTHKIYLASIFQNKLFWPQVQVDCWEE